jgi:hypothetical protein
VIKICYCGDTIKRPLHDPDHCSSYCRAYATSSEGWGRVRTYPHYLSLKCYWCGDNFKVSFGDRDEKVFCNIECSKQAQNANNWLLFNYCRVLARHPEGLKANAIARLLDEYAFHQTAGQVGSNMRKLVRRGIVVRQESHYRILHPQACGEVWLAWKQTT